MQRRGHRIVEHYDIKCVLEKLDHFTSGITATMKLTGLAKNTLKSIRDGNPCAAKTAKRIIDMAEGQGLDLKDCHTLPTPVFDPHQSFEYNQSHGPTFSDGMLPDPDELGSWPGELWGFNIPSRFGASAAPWTSAFRFCRLWAQLGCGIVTYSTVRTKEQLAMRFANNIGYIIDPPIKTPIAPEHFPQEATAVASYKELRSDQCGVQTNCYGVPSRPPHLWQRSVSETVAELTKRNVLTVLSVMGDSDDPADHNSLIADFANVVELALTIPKHPPPAIELNLSCPHYRTPCNPHYLDPPLAQAICQACRGVIVQHKRDTKLVAKIGWMPNEDNSLNTDLLRAFYEATKTSLDGISAINGFPSKIVFKESTTDAEPYFRGEAFARAALTGLVLNTMAIQTIQALRSFMDGESTTTRSKIILGMGGITEPEHVQDFLDAGANLVQASTVLNHNPTFPQAVLDHFDPSQARDRFNAAIRKLRYDFKTTDNKLEYADDLHTYIDNRRKIKPGPKH